MAFDFVDLFCGAGGLSLGLKRAGWTGLLATDIWEDALQTYRFNFDDARLDRTGLGELVGRSGDIVKADLFRSEDKQRLYSALGNQSPAWVVGGPPCKGFSTVGKRDRNDPRNRLVEEFAEVVEKVQPRGFLIENVLGLRDMNFVEAVVDRFAALGYTVTPAILTAADYGVPQLRRRIVFVGDRSGRYFLKPLPRVFPEDYVTVWDAIGDLPELGPGEAATEYDRAAMTDFQRRLRGGSDLLQGHKASSHPQTLVRAISYIPDGGNRRSIPDEHQPASGFHNSYSRLHSRSPAVAVTQNMGKPSGTRCIHPRQDRGLTAREGARLQSFPDWFHFKSGITSQREQVANAVPPILAEVIGQALASPRSWTMNVHEATAHNGMDLTGRLLTRVQLPLFAREPEAEYGVTA